jgi:histone acetyltransferase
LQNDKSAWPFIKPVDTSVVQDYDQIIDHPMGMSHSPYRRRSCLDCAR